jgi:hypothetical protein
MNGFDDNHDDEDEGETRYIMMYCHGEGRGIDETEGGTQKGTKRSEKRKKKWNGRNDNDEKKTRKNCRREATMITHGTGQQRCNQTTERVVLIWVLPDMMGFTGFGGNSKKKLLSGERTKNNDIHCKSRRVTILGRLRIVHQYSWSNILFGRAILMRWNGLTLNGTIMIACPEVADRLNRTDGTNRHPETLVFLAVSVLACCQQLQFWFGMIDGNRWKIMYSPCRQRVVGTVQAFQDSSARRFSTF